MVIIIYYTDLEILESTRSKPGLKLDKVRDGGSPSHRHLTLDPLGEEDADGDQDHDEAEEEEDEADRLAERPQHPPMLLLVTTLHVVQEGVSLALVTGQLLLEVRHTKVFLLCHEEGRGVTTVVDRSLKNN